MASDKVQVMGCCLRPQSAVTSFPPILGDCSHIGFWLDFPLKNYFSTKTQINNKMLTFWLKNSYRHGDLNSFHGWGASVNIF